MQKGQHASYFDTFCRHNGIYVYCVQHTYTSKTRFLLLRITVSIAKHFKESYCWSVALACGN